MNCLECQDWLQEKLDGVVAPCPPAVAQHLAACADCRALDAAAQRLLRGLRILGRVEPAPLLTQSIVTAVFDDRNRRARLARRVAISFSLAASVVIALVAGWWLLPPSKDPGPQIARPGVGKQQPDTPKLAPSAEAAREAVASLTERVADQTKGQAKLFAAMANGLDFGPMASLPVLSELGEPLDPAAKSLRQTTETVASGVEPITRSARRAFNFFAKEMPMFEIPQKN